MGTAPRAMRDFQLRDNIVKPGERAQLEIPVARLPTQTSLSLPVMVLHGTEPGPCLWLSAAVHGDEVNGVEIIRRVLERVDPAGLRGTLIAVPIVNVYGFLTQSRYLPDRRDLNRSFPGSARGSLAARLAHLFMTDIVRRCTHGIDLHTGGQYRNNLPHVRAQLTDSETRRCAEAFGAPVMVHARMRDGSLREAATRRKIASLLYEGGEACRFDKNSIRAGQEGVLRVMVALGMVRPMRLRRPPPCVEVQRLTWVRARTSGIFRREVELGEHVKKRARLGVITDAFGELNAGVYAPVDGVVIGVAEAAIVHQGDALVHVGELA